MSEDYQVRLQEQLRLLAEGLRRIIGYDQERSDELGEMHALAHRIHGTAGVMGYGKESALAANLEEILGDDDAPWEERRKRLAVRMSEHDWNAVPEPASPTRFGLSLGATSSSPFDQDATEQAHILVVDDEPEFVDTVARLASKRMVTVHSAHSLNEALAVADQYPLQGVLIDYYLDDQLGIDFALRLRDQNAFRETPFAFVSVDDSVATRVACVHAGAILFLEKPISDAALTTLTNRFAAISVRGKAKILVVDDDLDVCRSVVRILGAEGWSVAVERDSRGLLEACDRVRPDLVILDFMMPHVDGLDCCRLLRTSSDWSDVPVIFLTVSTSAEVQAQCFDAGADDFVDKPILPQKLIARVRNRLERQELLKRQAERDSLTGLLNRGAFLARFERRLLEAARSEEKMTICLIDIDDFKTVNTRFGHAVGDDVLRALGHRLRSRFRQEDLRSRWGGEEFVLLLVGSDAKQSERALQYFLDDFAATTFSAEEGDFHVTFSAGLAQYPEDAVDLRQLLGIADCRLSSAKAHGKNHIVSEYQIDTRPNRIGERRSE